MFDIPKVTKANGRQEEYVKEKVVVSCVKCGAPPETARAIADKVEENVKFPTKTIEIKNIVLQELDKIDDTWSDNWDIYDKAVKKRKNSK